MSNTNTEYTVHGVLAAAYRGRANERATLYHASTDGETALCGSVKAGTLCDEYGTPSHITEPTCPTCRARLGLEVVK